MSERSSQGFKQPDGRRFRRINGALTAKSARYGWTSRADTTRGFSLSLLSYGYPVAAPILIQRLMFSKGESGTGNWCWQPRTSTLLGSARTLACSTCCLLRMPMGIGTWPLQRHRLRAGRPLRQPTVQNSAAGSICRRAAHSSGPS
jgi:hypothetical protein